jgi:hypothetical protein
MLPSIYKRNLREGKYVENISNAIGRSPFSRIVVLSVRMGREVGLYFRFADHPPPISPLPGVVLSLAGARRASLR